MELRNQGYLAGFLLGDGSAHYNKANRAYEVSIDQIYSNRYLMCKLKKPLQKHGKVFHYTFDSPDGKKERYRVHNKDLYLQIKQLKEDPLTFFKSLDNIQKKEFIGGYIDADGTYTDRLVLYSKNYKLLEEILAFLKLENIAKTKIYQFNASSFNKEDKLIYGLQFSASLKKQDLNQSIPSIKLEYI